MRNRVIKAFNNVAEKNALICFAEQKAMRERLPAGDEQSKFHELQKKAELLESELQSVQEQLQTILHYERRGDRASKNKQRQQPVTTVAVAQKDISKMRWRDGRNAPQKMFRGAVIVHGNTAYIRPNVSEKVYAYQNIAGEERWSLLPVNPYENFGLVVIDGVLTSVGGEKSPCCTNELLSLREVGKSKQWSEILPSMPTRRHSAACVTTKEVLVAIGGSVSQHTRSDIVEVMNIETKQWTEVSSL